MNSELSREQILERFETWLDGALAAEEAPKGVEAGILDALGAPEDAPVETGSYALWSAMTALTQEVKLQGRSFKELKETLSSQAGSAERERELVRETERRLRKDSIGVLIDLRDRLARGLESAHSSETAIPAKDRRGWLARTFGGPPDTTAQAAVAALKKGYQLGLDRLDQQLDELNVREIHCQGQPFDPRRMNAIERQESDRVPEGEVLELYRSGYEWNGEVFRTAQVKVAVAPREKGK